MEFGQETVICKTSREAARDLCWSVLSGEWRPFLRKGSQAQGFKSTVKEYSMLA